jgi:hypothetical protein
MAPIQRVVTSGTFSLDGVGGDTTTIGNEIIHYDDWAARGH